MTIVSSASYYRTLLKADVPVRMVKFSSPLLAYTVEVPKVPAIYSGLDSIKIETPYITKSEGKISKDEWDVEGEHVVKQELMQIDFWKVSGGGRVQQDDIKWLFDDTQFPDWPLKDSRWVSFTEKSARAYSEAVNSLLKLINNHQFKVMGSRSFIYSGSPDKKMWDFLLGHLSNLSARMVKVNGGMLSQFERFVGTVPIDYLEMIRTKTGQEFTQTSQENTIVSVSKDVFQKITLAALTMILDTSTNIHVAGKASEENEDTLAIGSFSDPDVYQTMNVTFTGGSAAAGYFKQGDVITIKDKTWLQRDGAGFDSGVPMAFTVAEDSDGLTVRVSPGIVVGRDIAAKADIIGAKANVIKSHRKGFVWKEEASMFSMRSTPLPSTKYKSTVISGANAGYGPTAELTMSAILDSKLRNNGLTEIMTLMAYMAADCLPFYCGVLILPLEEPDASSYAPFTRSQSV